MVLVFHLWCVAVSLDTSSQPDTRTQTIQSLSKLCTEMRRGKKNTSLPASPSLCNFLLLFPAFQTTEGRSDSKRACSLVAWQCVMLLVICQKALSNAHELWLTWILISLGWDEFHCALSPTVQPVLTIPCLPVLSLIHLTDHLANHSIVLSLSLPSIKSFTPSFSKTSWALRVYLCVCAQMQVHTFSPWISLEVY